MSKTKSLPQRNLHPGGETIDNNKLMNNNKVCSEKGHEVNQVRGQRLKGGAFRLGSDFQLV